jgi:hypothetical protein
VTSPAIGLPLSLSSASCPETGFIRDSRFQQKFPHHTNTPCMNRTLNFLFLRDAVREGYLNHGLMEGHLLSSHFSSMVIPVFFHQGYSEFKFCVFRVVTWISLYVWNLVSDSNWVFYFSINSLVWAYSLHYLHVIAASSWIESTILQDEWDEKRKFEKVIKSHK